MEYKLNINRNPEQGRYLISLIQAGVVEIAVSSHPVASPPQKQPELERAGIAMAKMKSEIWNIQNSFVTLWDYQATSFSHFF